MADAAAAPAVVAQTEAQPSAPVADEGAPESSFADLLLGLEPATETEEVTAEAEATEAPAEKPPAAPAKEDPFSDAALATPEGIKKAREAVRELQKKHDKAYLRLSDREQRLKADVASFRSDKARVATLESNIRADLQALRRGDSNQALEALGRMMGKDALKAFEEIQLNIAKNGKRNEPSPEVLELREELRQLKEGLHVGGQKKQVADAEAFIAQRKGEIITAASDAAAYPHLARFVPMKRQEIADHVVELITEAHGKGQRLTDAEAIQQLETELRELSQAREPEPGLATGAAAKAGQKPAQPVRSTPGRSLSPGLTTQVGSVREISDEERVQELAKDTDYLRSLGLPV
jgi:hypothetical protein